MGLDTRCQTQLPLRSLQRRLLQLYLHHHLPEKQAAGNIITNISIQGFDLFKTMKPVEIRL